VRVEEVEAPKLVEEKTLCRGRRFALGQRVIEYRGVRVVRDVLYHPGAVVVLPLLDSNRVVMLRQFRPGPLEWVYELPAGTVEVGEDPAETARRELLEETGYEASRVELLFKAYPSPGTSTEVMYMYLATGLRYVGARPERGEFLEVVVVPLDKAIEMVREGVIVDGKTIMLLLYYKLFISGNP
jgi:ADP-ribose pyrophosphatase